MCLAQGPQRSDAGEARTRGPMYTLLIFIFYYKYLKYKNSFNLGIKTVLYLKYDFSHFSRFFKFISSPY